MQGASSAARSRRLFVRLLAAHGICSLAMLFLVPWSDRWMYLPAIMLFGVVVSQPALLAMWAVFAGQHVVVRCVVLLVSWMIVIVGPTLAMWPFFPNSLRPTLPQYLAYQLTLFGVCGAAFLLARTVLRWRIARPDVDACAGWRNRRLGFSLADLFGLTAFCAIAFGASRSQPAPGLLVDPFLRDGVRSLAALAVAPVAFRTARSARSSALLVLAAVALVAVAGIRSLGWSFPYMLGYLASVYLSERMMRRAGFELVRVERRDGSSEDGSTEQECAS